MDPKTVGTAMLVLLGLMAGVMAYLTWKKNKRN